MQVRAAYIVESHEFILVSTMYFSSLFHRVAECKPTNCPLVFQNALIISSIWNRVSGLSGWPQAHYVADNDLQCRSSCLSLPCAEITSSALQPCLYYTGNRTLGFLQSRQAFYQLGPAHSPPHVHSQDLIPSFHSTRTLVPFYLVAAAGQAVQLMAEHVLSRLRPWFWLLALQSETNE